MSEQWKRRSTPGNANPNVAELNLERTSAITILVDQNLFVLTHVIDRKLQKCAWVSGLGSRQKQACTSWVITERLARIWEPFQEPLNS